MPYFQPISFEAVKHISLQNFENIPWDMFFLGLGNTAILTVFVPTLVAILGVAISWVVIRSGLKFASFFDVLAFLPHAVPNIIFAVSAVFVVLFVLPDVIPLYGTIWLLVIVYAISKISFATRVFSNSLIQIHRELDEAGRVSGLPIVQVIWKILLPLLKPTILYTWLWTALLSFRELTLASVLAGPHSMTLPIVTWSFWVSGNTGVASAMALVIMGFMTPLICLSLIFGRRRLNWSQGTS
jgi:iron(III) transport system permease protein